MITKCHSKALLKILGLSAALTLVWAQSPLWAAKKPEISFGEFDKSEGVESDKDKPKKKRARKGAAPQVDESGEPIVDASDGSDGAKRRALPTIDEIVGAKLDALTKKLAEQKELLAKVDAELENERTLEAKAFDTHAYLALSIVNTAPPQDYRLVSTRVYLDGASRPLARGGKRNRGLPRHKQIFYGKVSPGCHEVVVEATYVRLKNDLISRFKVKRREKLQARQAFIANSGHRVELEIEGFEKHNTVADFFRGPALRFNKSVRPNFLPGAGIVSLDEVTKQGRVKIDYVTEDSSSHRLLQKSIAIDGLPILRAELHNESKQGSVVFDAALAEGKHRLNVTLLLAEKKWISGGANYNFRLKFERDFSVISGQTTLVNLTGLPNGGINANPRKSRYARATSKILSQKDLELFPEMTCKEIEQAEQEAERLATEAREKAEQAAKKLEEEAAKKAEDAAKKAEEETKKAAEQPAEKPPAPTNEPGAPKEPEGAIPVPPAPVTPPEEIKSVPEGEAPKPEIEPTAPKLHEGAGAKPGDGAVPSVPATVTKPTGQGE